VSPGELATRNDRARVVPNKIERVAKDVTQRFDWLNHGLDAIVEVVDNRYSSAKQLLFEASESPGRRRLLDNRLVRQREEFSRLMVPVAAGPERHLWWRCAFHLL